MRTSQKVIILIGLLWVFFAGLFPPRKSEVGHIKNSTHFVASRGIILSNVLYYERMEKGHGRKVSIDFTKLIVEWISIASFATFICVLFSFPKVIEISDKLAQDEEQESQ